MTSRAYYNEFDPKAAAWLRELIKEGLIAPGDVDERSITDILPSDLNGYTQCHFFAGIGGWSYSLRLAGVPDEQPIWTASLPCQPFSNAGKQLGKEDERHLWPVFFNLVKERSPKLIIGEQVEGAVRLGWLDGIFADLEGEDYACGAHVLGAHSVSAPHIRQRLYWLAHSHSTRQLQRIASTKTDRHGDSSFANGSIGRLAHTMQSGRAEGRTESRNGSIAGSGVVGGMGNADDQRPQRHGGFIEQPIQTVWKGEERHSSETGFWSDCDWLPCLDGKARRVESGTFPLAHGISGRVGLLRGYGNAIVPQVAAQFIQAAFEAIGDHDGRPDVLMDDPAF